MSEFVVVQKDEGGKSGVDRGVGGRREEEDPGRRMSTAGEKTKSGRRRRGSKERDGAGSGAEMPYSNGHGGYANGHDGRASRRQSAYGAPPPPEKDARKSVFVDGTNGAHRASLHPRASIFSTSSIVPAEEEEEREPGPYPLVAHLADGALLGALIGYLTFREWCAVMAVSKEVAHAVGENREAREVVLERFMGVVGYRRWARGREPLTLTLEVRLSL